MNPDVLGSAQLTGEPDQTTHCFNGIRWTAVDRWILLSLPGTSIDENYGGIDRKSWTNENARATFRHITAKVQAVGGADDRRSHDHTSVPGCPLGQPAPDSPQP